MLVKENQKIVVRNHSRHSETVYKKIEWGSQKNFIKFLQIQANLKLW